jgi:CRISPR-associated protein Cas2
MRRPAIVAYDVAENRRRRRLFRLLQGWRSDGQLSLHECLLTSREAEELFIQMREIIDPDTDRLLLAWLTPGQAVELRAAARSRQAAPGLLLHRGKS